MHLVTQKPELPDASSDSKSTVMIHFPKHLKVSNYGWIAILTFDYALGGAIFSPIGGWESKRYFDYPPFLKWQVISRHEAHSSTGDLVTGGGTDTGTGSTGTKY